MNQNNSRWLALACFIICALCSLMPITRPVNYGSFILIYILAALEVAMIVVNVANTFVKNANWKTWILGFLTIAYICATAIPYSGFNSPVK